MADYAADVALDDAAPRFLRIAGSSVSPRDLVELMTNITGKRFTFRLTLDGDAAGPRLLHDFFLGRSGEE